MFYWIHFIFLSCFLNYAVLPLLALLSFTMTHLSEMSYFLGLPPYGPIRYNKNLLEVDFIFIFPYPSHLLVKISKKKYPANVIYIADI